MRTWGVSDESVGWLIIAVTICIGWYLGRKWWPPRLTHLRGTQLLSKDEAQKRARGEDAKQ